MHLDWWFESPWNPSVGLSEYVWTVRLQRRQEIFWMLEWQLLSQEEHCCMTSVKHFFMCSTRFAPTILNLLISIFWDNYKFWSSSLHNFLQLAITSSLLCLNKLFNNPPSQTFSICSPPGAGVKFHTRIKTSEVVVLYRYVQFLGFFYRDRIT